jgi:hypothetical protein
MQNRGVQIVMIDDVFDCFMAELISLAMHVATFHAAAGEPGAEAIRIVIAADALCLLYDRQSPHFASPVHECAVQEAAAFQIMHQRCGGTIGLPAAERQRFVNAAVMIPVLVSRTELHEPHAPFDQPPRDQSARAPIARVLVVEAVQLFRLRRFLR